MTFERDPAHWLRRFAPREWISAAMKELAQAENAQGSSNVAGAVLGCKRAAGMALNAALLSEPNEAWGRTYLEHLSALEGDLSVPEAVRQACHRLLVAAPPSHDLAIIRTKKGQEQLFEAARDVIAHAYAVMVRHEEAV